MLDERDLVDRMTRGEQRAFDQFFDAFATRLGAFAARQPQIRSFEQLSDEMPLANLAQLTDFRDPLDECAADSERGAVRRAINRLPSHYARALELRFGEDLTVPEIARVLQISASAAESQLVRARRAFCAEWQRDAPPSRQSG